MKELNLGKSGLMVPEIALGCMRIASLEEKALEELLENQDLSVIIELLENYELSEARELLEAQEGHEQIPE